LHGVWVGDYWHFHFSSIHWLWFETCTLAFSFSWHSYA
jgi:hypothetical protein